MSSPQRADFEYQQPITRHLNAGLIWRVAFWALAILAWWYGLRTPLVRDAQGALTGAVVLPLAIGLALFVIGLAARPQAFAGWLALALVGQAAALQLIEAGKAMRYQHYLPFDRMLAETHPLLLAMVAAQSGLVLAGCWPHFARLHRWIKGHFKAWQMLALLLAFGLFSATVSHQVARYAGELTLAAFLQAVQLFNIFLVVMAIPRQELQRLQGFFERAFGRAEDGSEGSDTVRLDRFSYLAALWVTGLALVLSLFVYQRHPHIPDEVVYLYQARFLAQGALTLPAPAVPEAFDVYLMQLDGPRWYPSPPPGWPAMLAVGEIFGAPWAVNPILAGINTLLAYLLLGRLYSRRAARIGVFLLCVSPWYIFMAMNFMTHTFTLTCALAATLGVMQARITGQAGWGWAAGAALGVMSLIRPLEGLLMAGLLGLWAIWPGSRLKRSALAGLVMGAIVVGGLVLPYNLVLSGRISEFPINRYTDERFGPNANAYGFGPDRGMGWPIDPNLGHDPIDGLINADLNLFSINIELFGWGAGSLLLAAIAVLSGFHHRSDRLMLAVIAANFIFYFFYYFSGGPDFGARYWYLMILPLAALSGRGILILEGWLAKHPNPTTPARVLTAVLLMSAVALVTFFPWRAVDKYVHYLGMRPDVRELAQEYDFGRSLVLIRGDEHPDYASAFVYNPLDFNSDAPIFAWERSPEVRQQLELAFPGRQVWVVEGPSITGSGYTIVSAPERAEGDAHD